MIDEYRWVIRIIAIQRFQVEPEYVEIAGVSRHDDGMRCRTISHDGTASREKRGVRRAYTLYTLNSAGLMPPNQAIPERCPETDGDAFMMCSMPDTFATSPLA